MTPLVVLDAGVWSARCACGWSVERQTSAEALAVAATHRCAVAAPRPRRRAPALV